MRRVNSDLVHQLTSTLPESHDEDIPTNDILVGAVQRRTNQKHILGQNTTAYKKSLINDCTKLQLQAKKTITTGQKRKLPPHG